jgi:hypothetical protein
MNHRRTVPALLALAVGLATAAVGTTTAAAAPAPTSTAPATTTPATTMPSTTTTVELPTGDQVRVTQDGTGTHVTAGPGAGATAGENYTVLSIPTGTYVLPSSARADIGVSLDPALFDVTNPVLASGSANVAVTFRPGVAPHAVPGVRTTSVSGSVLHGVITSGSARTFGAAVDRRSLAGVSRVAPATTQAAAVTPAFAMDTLTVDVSLPTACASCAPIGVAVVNVDDAHRYNRLFTDVTEPFSISVPKGHYALEADVFGAAATGGGAEWVAMNPQFDVKGDSTVNLDLSTATQSLGVTTPMPATAVGGSTNLARLDPNGIGFEFGDVNATGLPFPVFVAPTTKQPTVGTLSYDFATRLAGPDSRYFYDLDFAGQGKIPADHQFTVSQTGLATIHETFGTSGALEECPSPAHPWGAPFGAACPGIATPPAAADDFVTADPQVEWSDTTFANGIVITPTVVVGGNDQETTNQEWRTFSAGEQIDRHWFSHPEAPNLLAATDEATRVGTGLRFGVTTCAICANGSNDTNLDLFLDPRGTNDTFGPLDPADTADYRVLADGVVVGGGDVSAVHGVVSTAVTMPATAHTDEIDYDVTRDPTANPLSTSSQTVWRFPAKNLTALPANWQCTTAGDTACSVAPALDAVPDLGTSADGTLGTGTDTGSLLVTRLGGGTATVRSVTVKVSYDGGKTWQAVPAASAGSGRYTLSLTVPAEPGTLADLKVNVKGTAGVTFSQTIQNAFAVSAS